MCHDILSQPLHRSFGASAVLLYGAPQVPFSQPRNVLGGHMLSCAVGVACHQLISLPMGSPWLAAPVAVAGSIMLMHSTRSLHPPAGGTTLIAVLGSEQLHALGFQEFHPSPSLHLSFLHLHEPNTPYVRWHHRLYHLSGGGGSGSNGAAAASHAQQHQQ